MGRNVTIKNKGQSFLPVRVLESCSFKAGKDVTHTYWVLTVTSTLWSSHLIFITALWGVHQVLSCTSTLHWGNWGTVSISKLFRITQWVERVLNPHSDCRALPLKPPCLPADVWCNCSYLYKGDKSRENSLFIQNGKLPGRVTASTWKVTLRQHLAVWPWASSSAFLALSYSTENQRHRTDASLRASWICTFQGVSSSKSRHHLLS